jgi:exodeoxyribonuclease VII large subunit
MNLFAPRKIYTVSEITADVKDCLESEFADLWVEGEISNFTAAASGHLYFALKDKGAQMRCVCFRSKARFLKFSGEDGLHVVACGNLSVYEPRGEYQLIVEFMEPKGLGSLQLAFEQLKARLQAEGLFDGAHKKPLPLLPRCIGIVTSPTGAALQDILRILRRRHESVRVLIYPARVQGPGAAAEIAAGIRALNKLSDIDVMIVGRGGGSLEDLWAFNEEIVARAIFESCIPVISAVGHEIDFTIADFVADLRAPTPSAAAELVVAQKSALLEQLVVLRRRLQHSLQFQLSHLRNRVLMLAANRVFASTEGRFSYYRQRLDELVYRLDSLLRERLGNLSKRERLLAADLAGFDLRQTMQLRRENVDRQLSGLQARARLFLQSARGKLQALDHSLQALNPLAVLDRGYAICRDARGNILRDAGTLQPGDSFSVKLARGAIDARAERVHKTEA